VDFLDEGVYILMNGSPTEEINIQRGLKQGDPLAPFLFLLVAEEFSGLMEKAVNCNLFKGFEVVRGGTVISHLQYADDTLCIGEATVDNLWTSKAILRGFEMVSELKVNFHKSCVMGVNVSLEFLEMASNFLNCNVGSLPFTYLGFSVGANAHCMATWEPMLEKIRNKLNLWDNRCISLGGCIVLLNSVLNSIPIFSLSFFKMPAKVVGLQRRFLWGAVRSDQNKICWVKWSKICQPKAKGGLGVRDIKLVNISLLAKWRWRLLSEEDLLWKFVLRDKYGTRVGRMVEWEQEGWPTILSRWWKDVMSVEEEGGIRWFDREVMRKVGNGMATLFWKDDWLANVPLSSRFSGVKSLIGFEPFDH